MAEEQLCFMLISLLTDKTAARKEWNLDFLVPLAPGIKDKS
jgi:hypothetical protein